MWCGTSPCINESNVEMFRYAQHDGEQRPSHALYSAFHCNSWSNVEMFRRAQHDKDLTPLFTKQLIVMLNEVKHLAADR